MSFTTADLEAYLDEALPPEEMAQVEAALRCDQRLLKSLAGINARRDSGVHSLGEIWRRNRLTCASREHLGGYLLGTLAKAEAEYIRFHIQVVGCRYCRANLEDLRSRQTESASASQSRRKRYFQSSAGYLRKR
jgi:hypothetical protein